jgi:hypothetical protein
MPDWRLVERWEREPPARVRERERNSRSPRRWSTLLRVSLESRRSMIIWTPMIVRIIEITKIAVSKRICGRSILMIIA